MVASMNTSESPIIIVLLAAIVVTHCKHSPDQNPRHTDSSTVTRQASTTIVSSSSTSADLQTPSPTTISSSAGGDSDTPGALVTHPWVDTKRVMDTSINAPGLQCAPKTFTRRDTLTLRMVPPHGEYLMVVQPDSTKFYLVDPDPRDPSRFLLMPSETFTRLPEIRFRADVRSKPQVYGRDTLEPLFRKPGEYILVVGHNLASDQSSEIYTCTVRLLP
jgi:hypothetical protein